ncbi:hypothetical protein MRX96_021304 [Rhipicephalus microplus]
MRLTQESGVVEGAMPEMAAPAKPKPTSRKGVIVWMHKEKNAAERYGSGMKMNDGARTVRCARRREASAAVPKHA